MACRRVSRFQLSTILYVYPAILPGTIHRLIFFFYGKRPFCHGIKIFLKKMYRCLYEDFFRSRIIGTYKKYSYIYTHIEISKLLCV